MKSCGICTGSAKNSTGYIAPRIRRRAMQCECSEEADRLAETVGKRDRKIVKLNLQIAQLVEGGNVVAMAQYAEVVADLANERDVRDAIREAYWKELERVRVVHNGEVERVENLLAEARKSRDGWALKLSELDERAGPLHKEPTEP
jgi:BMFP domain-containing protein YqiC